MISYSSQHIMMKSSRLEEDKNIWKNIIKDVRNLFSMKKLKNILKCLDWRYKKSSC